MEPDGRRYPSIDDAGDCLPQELHQDNHSEVGASPLGYHQHRLSVTRNRKFSSHEGCMNYGNNILPVSRVGVALPRCCTKPHPDMFGSHAGWAFNEMLLQTQHCLGNLLLPRDTFIHWEEGHLYGNRLPWWQGMGV